MRDLKLVLLALALTFSLAQSAIAQPPPDNDDTFNHVPEPASIAFLLTGLGIGAGIYFRRRK